MNFQNADLLTFDQLSEYISSDCPAKRADIISIKLKKYIFRQHTTFYKYNTDLVVYEKLEEKLLTEHLLNIVSRYFTASKEHLTQANLIKLTKDKIFSKMCENSNIKTMLPQLLITLEEIENKFSGDFYEIHYKNGYIDMKTAEFKQRIPSTHYVQNYIKRNYVASTEEQKTKILTIETDEELAIAEKIIKN